MIAATIYDLFVKQTLNVPYTYYILLYSFSNRLSNSSCEISE